MLRWFKRTLKGDEDAMPCVPVYVMEAAKVLCESDKPCSHHLQQALLLLDILMTGLLSGVSMRPDEHRFWDAVDAHREACKEDALATRGVIERELKKLLIQSHGNGRESRANPPPAGSMLDVPLV